MNDSETNLGFAPDNTAADLQAEVQSLRSVVVGALLALVIIGISLNAFMMRQASMAGNQAAEAQKFVDEFNTVNIPAAREFWSKLTDYSKTHPDFAPVMTKFGPFFQVPPTNPAAAAPKK
ncbi:MAG: hypothetical protein JWR69_4552 [Pedosphaera sp.]|nr:hypothetical protein [Pedosphaera sp.]